MKIGKDIATEKDFDISTETIGRHFYIVGTSGGGKSTLLEHIALSLIEEGHGVCFLDPHGQSVEFIADRVPHGRLSQVTYWEPWAVPIGYNPLTVKDSSSDLEKSLTVERVLAATAHVFNVGDRNTRNFYEEIETKILRNTLYLLLDNSRTLLDIQACLLDASLRQRLLVNCHNPSVRGFWEQEYAGWNYRQRVEYTASLLNKTNAYLSNPVLAEVLAKNTLDLRGVMDSGEVLLVNLSKGQMGADPSALLGSLLTAGLSGAALSRANVPESERRQFFLIIDEFPPFANRSFREILSEARKYKLSLILAHQYLRQIPDYLVDAIFGNTSTTIVFRSGVDADRLADLLELDNPRRIRGLPSYQALVRTLENLSPANTRQIGTYLPRKSGKRLEAVRRRTKGRY